MTGGEEGYPTRLCRMRDWVDRRAEATPWLVAFRFEGRPVSYSELAEALARYVRVALREGMSEDSGVIAGILHCAPELSRMPADRITQEIDGVLMWLCRDIDGAGAATTVRQIG